MSNQLALSKNPLFSGPEAPMHRLVLKLKKHRTQPAENEKGFTLIELLVVVVILGVLIAVAIPLYLNYRKGANDSASQSDVRNAISVLEVCNTDNNSYPTATFTIAPPATSAAAGSCSTQTINISAGTTLLYFPKTSGGGYAISTTNSSGTGKNFCYDSSVGGSILSGTKKATATGCA